MKSGIYCPATRTHCDRPCIGSECQRVKAWGVFDPSAPIIAPRPPDPDSIPIISPAQCRAARAYLDLTLRQLAKLAGMGAKTISRFETGIKRPADATLRKLIGALYDQGIEVVGSPATPRGIRDFKPVISMGRVSSK